VREYSIASKFGKARKIGRKHEMTAGKTQKRHETARESKYIASNEMAILGAKK
jgi:hypothetical protein